MLKKQEAVVTPEEIIESREAEEIHDLETINKIVSTINNKLVYLPYNAELKVSFLGEGYPLSVREKIANSYDSAGWDVYTYGDNRTDFGLIIKWDDKYAKARSKRKKD